MQCPERLPNARTVIERYGRKVELVNFREPPDGVVSEWLLFSSKQTPVIVFPLTTDGKVVAICQYRYGAGEPILELPGGLIEPLEDIHDAARREMLEETGYEAGDTAYWCRDPWFDPCCFSERFKPMLITGCKKVAEPTADHVTVELHSVEEWYRKCVTGGVVDSKSLAVSLMVLPHLPNPYPAWEALL
jgi:8-oxo-dGTP pyrophosphatase MutT (NUDIX family)